MQPMPELRVRACRSQCSWRATPRSVPAEGSVEASVAGSVAGSARPLFACAGCGSQWTPGAGWTPIDVDGRVPDEVLAAARAHAATSDRPAGAAGSADS